MYTQRLGIGYEKSKATITCNSDLAKNLLGDLQEEPIQVENAALRRCQSYSAEMLEEMVIFCLRVDKGTIRSKRTYEAFKNIIENVTEMLWADVKIVIRKDR